MFPLPRRRRWRSKGFRRPRGVTLLELLVVLTILGISVAAVAPALGRRPGPPVEDVLGIGRRIAVHEATRIRLHVDSSGSWTIVRLVDDRVLASGSATKGGTQGTLTLDALGNCVPAPTRTTVLPFDPLACRPSGEGR